MKTRTIAAVVPSIRNSRCSSFPTRDMNALERGGGRCHYSNHYRQGTPLLINRHRLHHDYNHMARSLSKTARTRRLQQQTRSQASFPKNTTTTTSQQQQPPLPLSSSSSNSNGTAGNFTGDLISLYSILLQRAALAAGIIYCFSEYVADITLCEGMCSTINVLCHLVDLVGKTSHKSRLLMMICMHEMND
jgi:hypothetical protein